jgi:type I restriction enzyme R subunit
MPATRTSSLSRLPANRALLLTSCRPKSSKLPARPLLRLPVPPFDQPALRDALAKARREAEQTIDTVTADEVLSQGFDSAAKDKAASLIKSFHQYIDKHKAEITALQILYSRPYKQRLTEKMLKDLEAKLKTEPRFGSQPVATLWHAYEISASASGSVSSSASVSARSAVKKNPVARFADLVSLVRFSLEQQPVLAPFADSVHERFNEWLMDKAKAGTAFTPEQLAWLNLIRDHIATSLSIEPEDLELSPFNQRGGLGRAHQLFGADLSNLLNELNDALAA